MEREEIFQIENEKYLAALSALTEAEIEAFNEDGTIPASLLKIVSLDSDMHFRFNELPMMSPSTGGYIFDDISFGDPYDKFMKADEEVELFKEYNSLTLDFLIKIFIFYKRK